PRRRPHAALLRPDPSLQGHRRCDRGDEARGGRAAAGGGRSDGADRALPGGRRRTCEWRLGYLPASEVDRAYGDSTLAIFPYKPGLDQSGTLLRALGAGVPAVAYDVGGLGENVRRF